MFENTQKKHFSSLSAKNFILKNYHKFSFKSCSKHKLNVLRCINYMLNVTSKKWKLCSKPTVSIGMYGVVRLLAALLSGAGEQRKSKQGRVSQWEWNNATLIVDDKWKLLTTIHSTIKKISFIFRHWGMPHQPFV